MTLRQWVYRSLYLKSAYWKAIRRRVARRAEYHCEVRGCRATAANLDAHHTTYSILGFEWLFLWKLVYLCRSHHNQTHAGIDLKLKRGWTLKGFGLR
jgi:hypothetical protein